VVKSLSAPVNYAVYEVKTDREDYNEGGVTRAQAKPISVFETVKGNAHWIEGDEVTPGDGTEPGGQWFKVTLEPGETIRPYGWALGHWYYGAAFTIRLYDEAGTYLRTLASIAAYGKTEFLSDDALGTYSYKNTAAETRTFYLQVFSDLNIVHDFEFWLALSDVEMKITEESYSISEDGFYTEDHELRVTAVRPGTGEVLLNWTGVVGILELENLDGLLTFDPTLGGTLPDSVSITSEGTATFVAKSSIGARWLADQGAWGNPLPAIITTTPYRTYAGSEDEINQWRRTKQLHDKAADSVPDWMQARIRDIYAAQELSLADITVLQTVSEYRVENLGPETLGETTLVHASETYITINPYFSTAFRMNHNAGGLQDVCDVGVPSKPLTVTLFHEARHAYQGAQANAGAKDQDLDFLVGIPYTVDPTSTVTDSTANRTVCRPKALVGEQLYTRPYKGDSHLPITFDAFEDPDFALHALEYDAYKFGMKARLQ
jgi:hypothetical protein